MRLRGAPEQNTESGNHMNIYARMKRLLAHKVSGAIHRVVNSIDDHLIYSTRLPEPMLLVALPKSASSFITAMLTNGLNINRQAHIGGGAEPEFLLNQRLVEEAAEKKRFAEYHIPAHPINRAIIAQYYRKMVVHLRDPRQATLSNLHNILRNQSTEPALNKPLLLPDGFFGLSFEAQLDIHLRRYLPNVVSWIQGWVDAQESPDFATDILFTRFEDFRSDRDAFFKKIFNFYTIPCERFWFDYMRKSHKKHLFRRGSIDEWETVFSEAQKKWAWERIPGELAQRFGWPESYQ